MILIINYIFTTTANTTYYYYYSGIPVEDVKDTAETHEEFRQRFVQFLQELFSDISQSAVTFVSVV